MADVNVKTIETRLQLKYDTYANWTDETQAGLGANLVLLKGEIGICEIPAENAEATTAPTVLFKVGDGTNPFKSLKWASALAADVYSWAKASDVAFDEVIETDDEGKETGRKHFIRFKNGDTVVKELDLSTFITDAEVKAITDPLTTRIAAVEALLGQGETGDGESIAEQIIDLDSRLDKIEGTGEGSIAQALADANAYTDNAIGNKADGETAATGLRKEIAEAEAAANSYTDGKVDELETKDAELLGKIGENTTAIGNEATARQEADNAINAKIGTVADGKTVVGLIEDAQKAGDDAQTAVNALTAEDGAVTKNTANIAQLTTDLATEATTRENADKALDERLKEVEAFFDGAKEDSEGLNDALDKLVDIQNYLSGDGNAAGDLVGQVSANAQAITDLQNIVKDGGTLEARVDAVEQSASANSSNITDLQKLTSGYTGEGAIKTAVDAVSERAEKGVTDAATAQAAAEAAQKDVDDLAAVVGDAESGLVQLVNTVKGTADDASAAVAALEPRVEQAEKDIDDLQAIVSTGDNSNAKLREAITDLETLVEDGAKGNEALYTEVTRVAGLVDNKDTGLVATNTAATDAQTRVAAIEADYLKAADAYIFNCGSSTTVTHVATAAN